LKNFTLLYPFFMVVLFFLFYIESNPIAIALNNFQTNLTTMAISQLLPSHLMEKNTIIITPHYRLVIEKACNGMIPFLMFLASILAFKSSLKRTILFAFGGYLILFFVNIFRIYIVSLMVLEDKTNFSLAHDYIGNLILLLTGVILFFWFTKKRLS